MTSTVAANQLERFRTLIVRRLGLQFEDVRLGFLAEVFERRLAATTEGPDVYLQKLDADTPTKEVIRLAQELTVAETYFFRHVEQYRAFIEIALPDRLRCAQAAGTRLNILSMGCASGEEPYSLAITVRDNFADRAEALSILGVDINPALLAKARHGRFSPWVLRETPLDIQRRWFLPEGREFVLAESVRNAVRFEVCNLADDRSELWSPRSQDIVFCRNVLMYFHPAGAQALVSWIGRSLRPGGYLFLGHAETLRGLSNEFHLRHTHGTFYYQKRGHDERSLGRQLVTTSGLSPSGQSMGLADLVDTAPTWIDTIRHASERIQSLVEQPMQADSSRGGWRSGPPNPRREIGLALELVREERFAEALDLLTAAFPPESDWDAEVVLLQAVLLTHSGQLARAERACERLLEIDELSAEAHYLLALCREGTGDQAGSFYHDQVAVYLDPSFAMAHLHLGLLARRTHDQSTARRELEQAVVLLQREDASRLLLFGGGFSRDALVELCRAELLGNAEHL